MTTTKIEVGNLPCPDWCTGHKGEKARIAEAVPDDAAPEECVPVGKHLTSLYWHKRFPSFPHPTAVKVHQSVSKVGTWEPQILFWHGQSGVDTQPGGPPATYQQILPSEARALGEALICAADLVGEILPDRCTECGEPAESGEEVCLMCTINRRRTERAERRARLQIIE